MTTDPIANFLTRLRNALLAKHAFVTVPATQMTCKLCNILVAEGYFRIYRMQKETLTLQLKYTGKDRIPSIQKIQRISKPGRRVYRKAKKMPVIYGGFGIAIISTTYGIMTDHNARRWGLGGEILCSIW